MAAGDVTLDSECPRPVGNYNKLTGTAEIDDTTRAFALTSTKSCLISVLLVNEDGVGTACVNLNENASGTATNGTFAAYGNHKSTETYRFEALYI